MTPSRGIEPGPHWWEARALTTVPSLHPQIIHQIELVQHRAARFVFRDYSNYTHVTPMLKQLGWDAL